MKLHPCCCLPILMFASAVHAQERAQNPGPGVERIENGEERRREAPGLGVENGWYVHGGKVIWGYAQHNGWWRPGQRPNLTRNAPGEVGPNRTEDLDKLTDAMLRDAYPGFEHNFGLWYDRRRDAHDQQRRNDADAVAPFLEQPWARSGEGAAWDGLTKYDLTKYNDRYFQRLESFADLCDRKGAVLVFNFYMQHALLETNAHYVDFPWRPENCLQNNGMPDRTPAANVFYDVTHPLRRELHQAYIRKCLDALGDNTNVVFLCSEEYTGPLSFIEFWLDTVSAWETESGRDVHVGLGATRDVIDAVLSDPARAKMISTIDLRYWWYRPDGRPFAPGGGSEVPGRYTLEISKTTPSQIHRQVTECRAKFPAHAIIHGNPGTRQHAWAALTGGASLLVGQLPYPGKKDPPTYISPELCRAIQPTYDFIRQHLPRVLPRLKPHDSILDDGDRDDTWCLSDGRDTHLIYTVSGESFGMDLSGTPGTYRAEWFDPRTGKLANAGRVTSGAVRGFTPPDKRDWALYLQPIDKDS